MRLEIPDKLLKPTFSPSPYIALTPHTYQLPSSPCAGALDHSKGLSAGVQSRLDPCPQRMNERTPLVTSIPFPLGEVNRVLLGGVNYAVSVPYEHLIIIIIIIITTTTTAKIIYVTVMTAVVTVSFHSMADDRQTKPTDVDRESVCTPIPTTLTIQWIRGTGDIQHPWLVC